MEIKPLVSNLCCRFFNDFFLSIRHIPSSSLSLALYLHINNNLLFNNKY